MKKFSGFTDEASVEIDGQIKALEKLEWNGIETRLVAKGLHFDDVDDRTFQSIHEKLEKAGIKIICYGSQIANGSRKITNDSRVDVEALRRIIPRMKKTGTRFVRIMSYLNDGWEETAWRDEAIRRLRELTEMAEDGGVILAHENCSGWAGLGFRQTLEMLDAIQSPALQLIFDTGNPVEKKYDGFEFYKAVRSRIVHVHIKDYKIDASAPQGFRAVMPGDGDGQVARIVADLQRTGYDAWYSMEPHISAVFHAGQDVSGQDSAFDTFVEYGKRFEALFAASSPRLEKDRGHDDNR
ncbi:MAG: sugar phosphate isomerase/epimerase family protein [Fibrobacterota bacterium]